MKLNKLVVAAHYISSVETQNLKEKEHKFLLSDVTVTLTEG